MSESLVVEVSNRREGDKQVASLTLTGVMRRTKDRMTTTTAGFDSVVTLIMTQGLAEVIELDVTELTYICPESLEYMLRMFPNIRIRALWKDASSIAWARGRARVA